MLRAINHSLSRVFGRSSTKRDELLESGTSTSGAQSSTAQKPTVQTTVVLGDWGVDRDQLIRSVMASCFDTALTAKDRAAYAANYRLNYIRQCQTVCATVYWDNENFKKGLEYGPKAAWEWSTPAAAELAEKVRNRRLPNGATGDAEQAEILQAFLDAQKVMADSLINKLKEDPQKSWTVRSVGAQIAEASDPAWVPTDAQISTMPLLDSHSSEICQKPDASSGLLSQLMKCEMSGGRGGYAWSWLLPSVMKMGPMDIIVMLPASSGWELSSLESYLHGCTALSEALVSDDFTYRRASKKNNSNKRKPVAHRLPSVMIALCANDAALTEALKEAPSLPKDLTEARTTILKQAVEAFQPLTAAGGIVLTAVADPMNSATVAKMHQSLTELRSLEPSKAPARAVQLQLALNNPAAVLEVVVPATPIEISHVAAEA